MRRGLIRAACVVGLAGPVVLAFFTGGFFDEPRAWAGLIAWLLVVVALLAAPDERPLSPGAPGAPGGARSSGGLPRSRGAVIALGALALYGAWTLLSITWAPVAGNAYHAGQLVLLYLGAMLAAAMLLRSLGAVRAVEPALAAGALVVIGYGLSERLLPGLLHFSRSASAQGRLEQPLTYWNAMGELAALGVVLCARVAGDATRRVGLRALAAAAAAPLGLGLYLSFSRGALFACAAGLVTLIVAAPQREQLHALVLSIAAGVIASGVAAPLRGVNALAGGLGARERDGAIALAVLALVMVLAALLQRRLAARERTGTLRLPRRAPAIALVAICCGLAVAIVAGAKEKSSRRLSAGASRYVTLQSNRYSYWRVALRAFDDEPLRGVGAGGWSVYWLRYRPIDEFAQDAHSLPLQTLAELGIVGTVLLLLFFGGVALAARDALRTSPALAAGPTAVFVAYAAHSPLDWDWQMPALSLTAIIAAGALLALSDARPALRATAPPQSEALPV